LSKTTWGVNIVSNSLIDRQERTDSVDPSASGETVTQRDIFVAVVGCERPPTLVFDCEEISNDDAFMNELAKY